MTDHTQPADSDTVSYVSPVGPIELRREGQEWVGSYVLRAHGQEIVREVRIHDPDRVMQKGGA